jgi:hypothetical protein
MRPRDLGRKWPLTYRRSFLRTHSYDTNNRFCRRRSRSSRIISAGAKPLVATTGSISYSYKPSSTKEKSSAAKMLRNLGGT